MALMDTKAVYRSVIDEVTTKSRPEFVTEGVDEAVLDELRVLWEEKLQASGVLSEPQRIKQEPNALQVGANSYYTTVQSAVAQNMGRPAAYLPNIPYGWQQRPPAALGHTVQTGNPQYANMQQQAAAQSQPAYQGGQFLQQARPAVQNSGYGNGAQQGYIQPNYANPNYAPAWQQQASTSQAQLQYNNQSVQAYAQNQNGVNTQAQAIEDASRKRKAEELLGLQRAKQQMLQAQNSPQLQQQVRLPQQDGPSEASDKAEDEEEPEREELENFSDVASSDEEEENVPNTCISQFVKVQRTKNKWKCQLRGGIMHLNGRDHIFGNATGDFQF